MNKKELIQIIQKTSILKGNFTLRSGQKTTEYFDKYLFESNPRLIKTISYYLQKLLPPDTEVLAGLVMGGIPLAVALSLETNLPCVFVRKKAKEYGTKKIIEGCEIKNKKVCIVEDVITTGGQVIASVAHLRKEAAIVESVICAIHRGGTESKQNLHNENLHLHPLLTAKDFCQ